MRKKEQEKIRRMAVCRLQGHMIRPWWHNKFIKGCFGTKRIRVRDLVCDTCTNETGKLFII